MAQLFFKNFQIFRRSYAVAAEKKKMQAVTGSVMRKTADLRGVEVSADHRDPVKETFWMRDPKTGNWIPENHFGDIDVAELREKLLSKKH